MKLKRNLDRIIIFPLVRLNIILKMKANLKYLFSLFKTNTKRTLNFKHLAMPVLVYSYLTINKKLHCDQKTPCTDCLNKFNIEINDYFNNLQKSKHKDMVKRDLANDKHFVILGGGPAALSCAETLRSAGFTVRLI
jgi:hypothetical protein